MYDLQDQRWIKNSKQLDSSIEMKVVLTFDDGPSRQLNRILDILRDRKVSAIFFWQSKLLYKERPWKRVIEEGHAIGAHTYSHKNLVKLRRDQQLKQIKMNISQIEDITGYKVNYFRPPFGQYNEDTMSILDELDLIPMMWEISSYDWENKLTPNRIIYNVVENIMDGSIILLHELEQTVTILPQLIDEVRGKGFEFIV
ncbi:polysaccharide deacetylase family protein [Anaerobacillus alkaliphilus]|uniref:Polysaccharide deacetylase family protein n=1 Tax=Anaerobacillus alkaliphilus TaxID=1548597 RepID=A0A4Q0VRZ9_9BACI|nr:polysaccharide deacetylase family protein [Anaerobacillus alkaliphilus]RXI99905.1 polysaccharide deacetylase family protein [Anaerobacillus alkaliphilus]